MSESHRRYVNRIPLPWGFVLFGKAMDAVSSLLCCPLKAVSALSKHDWQNFELCSRHKDDKSTSDHSDEKALPALRSAETCLLTQWEDSSSVPACAQPQSNLLSRLPYEIRRQIYEGILGGHLFHVVRLRERLAHVRCRAPYLHHGYTITTHNGCWGIMDKDMLHVRYLVSLSGERGRLALLKTCRQVYVDYSSLDFSLPWVKMSA